MNDSAKGKIAVVGGGMAGTAAAWRLQALGYDVTLFEANDRIGGRMWSLRKGDFVMDAGMSAYLGTYREAIALIHEAGLSDQLSDLPAIGGFRRDGRNYAFNYKKPLRAGLTTNYLTLGEKLKAIRLGLDTYRHRKSLGYSEYTSLAAIDDETVAEYCRRRLDEGLLNYIGKPLVSGTWVARDDDTSIALLFWTIRNMLAPSVYNLRDGVAVLPQTLSRAVTTRLSSPVSAIEDHGKQVAITSPAGTETFVGCVLATTAESALKIYPQMDENSRSLYSTNRYRKLGNICIGLSRRPDDPCTYYLPTPHEDEDTIAVIADHNKAPGRAPEGKGLLSVLLSHEYLERSENVSDDDMLGYAINRASTYYRGVQAQDVEQSNIVRWDHSVPTLFKGRFRMIADYAAKIDRKSRVQLASDMDRIPGCNGALVSGEEAAQRLSGALSAQENRIYAMA